MIDITAPVIFPVPRAITHPVESTTPAFAAPPEKRRPACSTGAPFASYATAVSRIESLAATTSFAGAIAMRTTGEAGAPCATGWTCWSSAARRRSMG
jgi:hypothetical protein